MQRRSFIAALATGSVALAGCSTSTGGDPPTDSVTPYDDPLAGTPAETTPGHPVDETPTPTEEPSAFDELTSVIELETVPRTYAFGSTRLRTDDGAVVRLRFDRIATAEHPARLTGTLRNGNDYANTFEIEWIPAVGRVHSRQPDGYDHEARLHLAPTEHNDLAETVPEVARTDDGLWYATDIGAWITEQHRLEPGETVDLEYVLVGESGMPGRPTGTYEFRGREETVSVTVWETNSPGPEAPSRFAGRSLPAFDGETITWYHEATRETQAFVRPSTERLELDGRAEFEMINNSHEPLSCGHWNLYKFVDGQWFHVGPGGHFSDCRVLRSGGRKTWSLRAFNGEPVPCDENHLGITRGYLGGGEYAVVAGYGHATDSTGALIELVGDQVTVTPTDDSSIERDGETVTVTTDSYGDGEHPPDATVTLTRTDEGDERLLAEQVMGAGWLTSDNALRNALAVIEPGVEEVVVRTDEHAADDATGFDSTTRRFRFRDQAYEVTNDLNAD